MLTDQKSSKGLFFLSGLVFCLLLSFSAQAQSERERVIQDLPSNSDNFGQYESPEASVMDLKYENSRNNANKTIELKPFNGNQTTKRENPVYRQGGERDNRKEGMSTLSFNLFLYIVDKFKED